MLTIKQAVRLMRQCFEDLAGGRALNQPRRRLVLPSSSVLHYMVAGSETYFGAKIYSTHPMYGAHFLFLLYRAADAEPLALIEANYLGQIRTGAVTGLATQLMARSGSRRVGIIGTGFQARSQLDALVDVWPVQNVQVWSRSPERRHEFASSCSKAFGIAVEAAASAKEAVQDADIIVTATNAREPVLEADWIAPGTHINAMGSNQAKRRELPAALVRRADRIVVDSLEQSRMESGDLLLAFEEEDWKSTRLVELQDVVAGRSRVREHEAAVTIFKSNGLAVEDVTAAGYVYERALESNLGRNIDPRYS